MNVCIQNGEDEEFIEFSALVYELVIMIEFFFVSLECERARPRDREMLSLSGVSDLYGSCKHDKNILMLIDRTSICICFLDFK